MHYCCIVHYLGTIIAWGTTFIWGTIWGIICLAILFGGTLSSAIIWRTLFGWCYYSYLKYSRYSYRAATGTALRVAVGWEVFVEVENEWGCWKSRDQNMPEHQNLPRQVIARKSCYASLDRMEKKKESEQLQLGQTSPWDPIRVITITVRILLRYSWSRQRFKLKKSGAGLSPL